MTLFCYLPLTHIRYAASGSAGLVHRDSIFNQFAEGWCPGPAGRPSALISAYYEVWRGLLDLLEVWRREDLRSSWWSHSWVPSSSTSGCPPPHGDAACHRHQGITGEMAFKSAGVETFASNCALLDGCATLCF